jgi:FkbM family methyltransferase
MKIKNLFELLGFRGKLKRYLYEINEFNINQKGLVKYPQWKHPRESKKIINEDLVKGYATYINKGDFCIDIGAHTGDTSLPMALVAGVKGCVLALEPNPYVYTVLEKTARANSQVANIKTIMAAVGQKEGFMDFEYSDSGFCNGGRHKNISSLKHGHGYKLNVFTIDLTKELRSDYTDLLPNLRFIKVDTEGYDLFVLTSIEQLISQYRPIIKSEIFKQTDFHYRCEMLDFFEKLNYTVFKIKEEPLGKGDHLNKENINDLKHFDLLALPN